MCGGVRSHSGGGEYELGSEFVASRAPHVQLSVVAYLPSLPGASRRQQPAIVLDVRLVPIVLLLLRRASVVNVFCKEVVVIVQGRAACIPLAPLPSRPITLKHVRGMIGSIL